MSPGWNDLRVHIEFGADATCAKGCLKTKSGASVAPLPAFMRDVNQFDGKSLLNSGHKTNCPRAVRSRDGPTIPNLMRSGSSAKRIWRSWRRLLVSSTDLPFAVDSPCSLGAESLSRRGPGHIQRVVRPIVDSRLISVTRYDHGVADEARHGIVCRQGRCTKNCNCQCQPEYNSHRNSSSMC